MRAIGFSETGSIANVKVLDIPEPGDLKEGEVRLKFLAGSLNHLDLWVIKGLRNMQYSFPHIAGADVCGKVIKSRGLWCRPGDRVLVYPANNSGNDPRGKLPENLRDDFQIRGETGPGVFREELVVHEKYIAEAPDHLSDIEAAALPLVYLTA